jgi:DNA invertase Pin-like site-specific DNA recombinase
MAPNSRLSITFTRRQLDFLEKEAFRLGIPLSEVVRQIVDRQVEKMENANRALIRAPMSEGWKGSKTRSVKRGRGYKLTEHQRREAIKRRDEGVETLAEIGGSYNVSAATIWRLKE